MPGRNAGSAGRLPIRRENDVIVVDLPRRARRFVADTADMVRRTVEDPSSPGFGRLYGRLDEGADADDPLVTFERQTAIDETCTTVIESAHKRVLSDAEGDAWLRTLGMAVALTAAGAGIRTEDDVDRLDPHRTRVLDLLRSLQLLLALGLDPELGDPPGG